MKILLISDYASPRGGAEQSVLHLRDCLREQGHDARLFASTADGGGSNADFTCFGTTSRWRTLLQTYNPWACWQLRSALRAFRPDVVHVSLFLTQLSPGILPLLRRLPVLYQAHWHRVICPTGFKTLPNGRTCAEPCGRACLRHHCLPAHHWVLAMMQMHLVRRWKQVFDRVLAVSHSLRMSLQRDGFACDDVLSPGAPLRASQTTFAVNPTVGFAGRLVPEKGLITLLHAFAATRRQIPNAKLLVAGDGPARTVVVDTINILGLQDCVTMYGHLSRHDLEALFATLWVQVVPSLMEEPFGLVAIEAMLRGTPVVASDAGGLRETVVHNEVGLLVPPGDAAALAQALIALLSDRQKALSMGARARQYAASRFTDATYTHAIVSQYQALIDSHRRNVHVN